MHRVIVGTAGHVDHGKTRLLEALTGIDCDRLAEEKTRGITIDLGFAHLEDGDLQLGFIDVPGHERFLHNALAGLGGVRIMLLVVSAEESVKPQTREHLAICSLLGIPKALVALTKRDLVTPDLVELVTLEVEELLAPTPFAGAPILAVSSLTGEGIPELRAALVALAREVEPAGDAEAPLRLPVDRAFQLRGLGAVVTGTLVTGSVAVGDTVEVLPGAETARVRSLQVHGAARERALPGERTAVQLAGLSLEHLERGRMLTTPRAFAETRTLCARLSLLDDAPELRGRLVEVGFHLFSSEEVGKLRPLAGTIERGGSGLVEIRLARPVVAVRGDRFIIRRPSPPQTLGGGVILDPLWRRRRGAPLAAALEELVDDQRALELWVGEGRENGVGAAELARRLGVPAERVERRLGDLTAAARLVRFETGRERRWLLPQVYQAVEERARWVLRQFFHDERLARGMPKAELVERILPRRAAGLAEVYLEWLEARKVLVCAGEVVNLPGREAQLTGEESRLAREVMILTEAGGLTPPSPAELARRLGAKPQILEGVQRYLIEQGRIVRLPDGLIVSTQAVEQLRRELLDTGWERFSVPQFKDRFGLSRKWAIPHLEHLDSIGATRRLGDERQVVRRGP